MPIYLAGVYFKKVDISKGVAHYRVPLVHSRFVWVKASNRIRIQKYFEYTKTWLDETEGKNVVCCTVGPTDVRFKVQSAYPYLQDIHTCEGSWPLGRYVATLFFIFWNELHPLYIKLQKQVISGLMGIFIIWLLALLFYYVYFWPWSRVGTCTMVAPRSKYSSYCICA